MKNPMNLASMLPIAFCLFAASITVNGQQPATVQKPPSYEATANPSAKAHEADHEVIEQQILNELRQIRALLEKQQQAPQPSTAPATQRATVSISGQSIGSKNAPVTLVEFADYQCPFCKQFQTTVFDRLKKDYIDTGKVRFISRDLPLDFHPHAMDAAVATQCAGEQAHFWQMRDTLISHSDNLAPEAITKYATEIGLDMNRFHTCIGQDAYASAIRQNIAEANAAGISGTPSFVIGKSSGGSVEGEVVVGASSYESFKKDLDDSLAQLPLAAEATQTKQ
jgi:protein-disulfide isomerase